MFERQNQSECYESEISVNPFFFFFFLVQIPLVCCVRHKRGHNASVRQPLNQNTICCAKLLIPSEMTRMLTRCVLFFPPSAPPTVRIIHSGHACNVEEERHTERVYTIREGETLELTCLVTGHPRPQVRNLVPCRLPLTGVATNSNTRESWDGMLILWPLLPVCLSFPHSPSAAFFLILY